MGRYAFPHNQRLARCIYPRGADHEDARRAFHAWRTEIVTKDGARGFSRTRRPNTPDGVANSTVSEGIAYGMLIAVMFDDQPLFDDFWSYAQLFLAWSLVMAHRQWGGRKQRRYLDNAKQLTAAIYETEVDHGTWRDMLIPGDDWRGRDAFNPSYFAPNQFRLFAEIRSGRDVRCHLPTVSRRRIRGGQTIDS